MDNTSNQQKFAQENMSLAPKELLLQLITSKYGPHNAVVVEDALKTQKKQIEDGMLNYGMSAEDIMKSRGIDIGSLNSDPKIMPSAGGLFTPAKITQDGNIQEGGPLSWIGGNNSGVLLKKLLVASEINKNKNNSMHDSVYQEDRKLEVELKKAQLEQLRKTGVPASEEDLFSNIPKEEQEDYIVKPIQQTIRGIKTTVPILERKKTLPAKELNDLGELENTTKGLNEIVDILQKSGLEMGPGFSTTRGAISDMLAQMKGPEFSALKSKIGRSFQQYRKWATGVAAGYAELNLLGPNYIKPTDTNEVLIQKALDIAAENERNRTALLDNFSNGGYAVSKLRNKSSSQQGSTSSSSGMSGNWDDAKEARYQELLRKRGKNVSN